MIVQYTVNDVCSWQRDKARARIVSVKPVKVFVSTYRPAGDAEDKALHAKAAEEALFEALGRKKVHPDMAGPAYLQDQWRVQVIYSPANERTHDTDRVLNLVLDALIGVVWKDDSDKYVVESGSKIMRGDKRFAPGTTTVMIERVAGPYVAAKKTRARRAA